MGGGGVQAVVCVVLQCFISLHSNKTSSTHNDTQLQIDFYPPPLVFQYTVLSVLQCRTHSQIQFSAKPKYAYINVISESNFTPSYNWHKVYGMCTYSRNNGSPFSIQKEVNHIHNFTKSLINNNTVCPVFVHAKNWRRDTALGQHIFSLLLPHPALRSAHQYAADKRAHTHAWKHTHKRLLEVSRHWSFVP